MAEVKKFFGKNKSTCGTQYTISWARLKQLIEKEAARLEDPMTVRGFRVRTGFNGIDVLLEGGSQW